MSADHARVVDVIVVTYSPGDTLAAFLASLPQAGRVGRIILADNGSTDGSVEAAVVADPAVSLLRTGGNLGYGGAINAAAASLPDPAASAAENFLLICNPDVVLHPHAIDELVAAAARHPRAGAIGPRILTPSGQTYPSARDLPSIGRGIGHAVCGWWWPSNPWTRAYRRQDDSITEREAGWLSGACLLLRRAAFDQIGGFDPAYFMYFEDVDLGDRLHRAGWLNIYAPDAVVTHTGGHSTSQHGSAMTRAHHASAYRYLASRYGHWWQAPLRLVLRAGLGLRSALASRSGTVSAGAALPDEPGPGAG